MRCDSNLLRLKMLSTKKSSDEFSGVYNGYQARVFASLNECVKFLDDLKVREIPYKAKIVKHKLHGLQFVVMRVPRHGAEY